MNPPPVCTDSHSTWMVCRCFLTQTHQWTSAVAGFGLASLGASHGERELTEDKRSVILWLEPKQRLNDTPPPTPTPSSFQISHRTSGLSGQHHVDHRPLVPISAPPPCTVSLSPMVKRPRRVPFHISFWPGMWPQLRICGAALQHSMMIEQHEFPLLWCP